MKTKISLIFSFLLFSYFLESHASNRILYVNEFREIIGDKTREDELLEFGRKNGFDKIILYELHLVNKDFPMNNVHKNQILANFIYKAKTKFQFKEVIGTGENSDFFINAIDAYNRSRKNPLEKFDTYNLEFEYWKEDDTSKGGYYCENYLKNDYSACNRNSAFNFFIKTLQTMKKLAKESKHPIKIEAYVGKFNSTEINKICNYVDRLLVHVYVRKPQSGKNYVKERMEMIAAVKNQPKISIIYSSETVFMGGWLKFNSLEMAEKILIYSLKTEDAALLSKINLTDFTYYNYTNLTKSIGYYLNQSASNSTKKNYQFSK